MGPTNTSNIHTNYYFLGGVPVGMSHAFFILLLLFFWTSLCVLIALSLLGVGIPSHNSGYKVTRLCTFILLSCYLVLPALIPGPSSLPVQIPPPRFSRFAPPLRPTPLLLFTLPPPSPIRPDTTTAETPTPLASNQTTHISPESAALQYTARPYSASS